MGKCINQHATGYILTWIGHDGDKYEASTPAWPLDHAMKIFRGAQKAGRREITIKGVRALPGGGWRY